MFRLGTLLFIPGYTTVTLYRVLVGPDSGGTLLLMIRWCFSRYIRGSILLTSPFLKRSLDNQHVSGINITLVSFTNCFLLSSVLCGIAARPSRSRRCQFS